MKKRALKRWVVAHPVLVKQLAFLLLALALINYINRFRSDGPLGETLEKLVNTYAADNGFWGVVLVVSHGDTLLHNAWGPADGERGERNNVNTRFPAGDVTQLLTRGAAAVMAAQYHFDADSMITEIQGQLLPQPVTLFQLLNHYAGLSDAYAKDMRLSLPEMQERPIAPAALLHRLLQYAPDTLAGAVRRYHRTGPALARLAMSAMIDTPYAAWVGQHLFQPLNMTHSTLGVWGDTLSLARGHRHQQTQCIPQKRVSLSYYAGAADWVCTARDMAALSALPGLPGVARPESLRLLGRLDHYGRMPGYRSAFLHMPLQELTVVILANQAPVSVEDMATQLATLVLQRRLIELPPDSLAPFCGLYEGRNVNGEPLRFLVKMDESQLMMTVPGHGDETLTVQLRPESPQRFLTELFRLHLNVVVDFLAPDRCTLNISGWTVKARRIASPDSLSP